MLNATLRTKAGEQSYQEAIKSGTTRPLQSEPTLQEWAHWRLINNRFPYGMAFKTHHMLLPRRTVADRWGLNDEEKREFEQLLREYVYPNYDLWFENCPKRRSVLTIYHVHLVSYFDTREEIKL